MQTKRTNRHGDAEDGRKVERKSTNVQEASKKRPTTPEPATQDTNSNEDVPEEAEVEQKKHIHPCICDIDKRRMAAIHEHLRIKRTAQQKFENRIQQLADELRMAEEAEMERLRQLEEEKEFYGDEYIGTGLRRKRKKRSARRVSMVSLGVKQIIMWKKEPRIEVKPTKASKLRAEFPAYCGRLKCEEVEAIPSIKWNDYPKIPIRMNKTVTLRNKQIKKSIETMKKQENRVKYPNRPAFTFLV